MAKKAKNILQLHNTREFAAWFKSMHPEIMERARPIDERQAKLAVTLHTNLCPNTHDGDACRWFASVGADDPAAADWTEPAHAFWLACCHAAISFAQATGWSITIPPDPEPEPEPEE